MNRLIRSLILAGFCLSFTPSTAFAARPVATDAQVNVTTHTWVWSAPEKLISAQEVIDYVILRLDLYQQQLKLSQFSYVIIPGEKNNFTLSVNTNLPHNTIEQVILESWPAVFEGQKGKVFPQSARVLREAEILPQDCTPRDTEKRFVEITTTSNGAIKLANITALMHDQKLAIYLGEQQIIAPVIKETITGGKAKIDLIDTTHANEAYMAMQKGPQKLAFFKQHPLTLQWLPLNLNGEDLASITLAGLEEEGPPHCRSYSLTFPIEAEMLKWLESNPKEKPLKLAVGEQSYGEIHPKQDRFVLSAQLSQEEVNALRGYVYSPGFKKALSFLTYSSSQK